MQWGGGKGEAGSAFELLAPGEAPGGRQPLDAPVVTGGPAVPGPPEETIEAGAALPGPPSPPYPARRRCRCRCRATSSRGSADDRHGSRHEDRDHAGPGPVGPSGRDRRPGSRCGRGPATAPLPAEEGHPRRRHPGGRGGLGPGHPALAPGSGHALPDRPPGCPRPRPPPFLVGRRGRRHRHPAATHRGPLLTRDSWSPRARTGRMPSSSTPRAATTCTRAARPPSRSSTSRWPRPPTSRPGAPPKDAMVHLPGWAAEPFTWGPDVHQFGSHYVLYFTGFLKASRRAVHRRRPVQQAGRAVHRPAPSVHLPVAAVRVDRSPRLHRPAPGSTTCSGSRTRTPTATRPRPRCGPRSWRRTASACSGRPRP